MLSSQDKNCLAMGHCGTKFETGDSVISPKDKNWCPRYSPQFVFFYYFQCIFVYWLILRPCCMHTETTQIIKHMMSPNAADRPTIDELLAYKFLGRCAMYFCASYRPAFSLPSRLYDYSDIEKRIRRQDGKINELQKRIRQLQGRKLAWSSNAMAKRPTLRRTTTL